MQNGIITKGIGGFYYVLSENKIVECKARGVFRKENIIPMVGDRVNIEVKNGRGSITEIMQRSNFLIRPAVSNVDILVIVVAAASPDPNMLLLDKMIVQAEKSGILPVICINKTDIKKRPDIALIYKKAGYTVFEVSAKQEKNIDSLRELISGRITAFSGLSGVGKSSLLNLLTEANMETGGLSRKIERGKHTTRHVELIPINGGYVFDTPGFSSLDIPEMSEEELIRCFPELNKFSSDCKFRGCSHIKDSGCAVRKAVEDGMISRERYNSYCSMAEILKSRKAY